MIELQESANGLILPVQAQPGAKKNGVVGEHAGRLKVAVTQAPEKGKANKALIEVLAADLKLKRSQIELLSGETNSQKRFLVTGLTVAELEQRISQALGGDSEDHTLARKT
ncbi:MAG: DUF167 domain-containing protein [Planctomycetota bacterium]|nr:DUF167 domain-containing protein [Planctomycetota bacterium]